VNWIHVVWVWVAEQENSLPDVWGEDADEWNPERFLDHHQSLREASSGLGVFGNLCVVRLSQPRLTERSASG
jgi:hypothetical protein